MPDVVENAIKPSMRIIRVSKARDERQAPMFFCPSNRSRRRELESFQRGHNIGLRFRALQPVGSIVARSPYEFIFT